jgi:two-component system repressor protein LuxO
LQNVIRNLVIMNPGGEVTPAQLPPQIAALAPGGASGGGSAAGDMGGAITAPTIAPITGTAPEDIRPLEDVERDAIEHAIELCDGNVRMAAAYLEVSPATLYRKRAKWSESDAE